MVKPTNSSHIKGHLHFIGIAGHAMRGVALAARDLGYTVSGTDETAYPPGSDWLDDHQLQWWREPDAKHLHGVTTIIISGGTKPTYPLLVEARKRGIEILSFAQFVGQLAQGKHRIVVAGTHGKTTTTSMIAWLLESAKRQPDFLVGIQPRNFDSSVRLTDSDVMVLEGDEYRSSQLDNQPKYNHYSPDVLVLTSVEMDHPDMFQDLAEIKRHFTKLVAGMPRHGRLYYWGESENVELVAGSAKCAIESYGLTAGDWRAENLIHNEAGSRFNLVHQKRHLGELVLPLYGRHNVLNALAASAVAINEGLTFKQLQKGLATFKGAARRFELLTSQAAPIAVYDDYAHHPTEVAATIEAARLHFGGRVIVVFRPHTFSRTHALMSEYHQAFKGADVSFITDIEGAREDGQATNVSAKQIVQGAGGQVYYEPDRASLIEKVVEAAHPGDTVLCMTVSGWDGLARQLAKRLTATPVLA